MSHHSSKPPYEPDDDPSARKAMSEAMREIFGEFPDGKLNADDEGALACVIGHDKGNVVMRFPKPVAWIGFTPQQALDGWEPDGDELAFGNYMQGRYAWKFDDVRRVKPFDAKGALSVWQLQRAIGPDDLLS